MSQVQALIADDSEIMRDVVTQLLNTLPIVDFEFLYAENGKDALKKYQEEDVEIVFVDWEMPVMTGVEFCRTVRDRESDEIPIIMVTAEKSMEKRERALAEGGVDEYITKPLNLGHMLSVIGGYFDEDGNLADAAEERTEK